MLLQKTKQLRYIFQLCFAINSFDLGNLLRLLLILSTIFVYFCLVFHEYCLWHKLLNTFHICSVRDIYNVPFFYYCIYLNLLFEIIKQSLI